MREIRHIDQKYAKLWCGKLPDVPSNKFFSEYKDMNMTDVRGDVFLMDYFLADTLFLSCGCQVIDSNRKET